MQATRVKLNPNMMDAMARPGMTRKRKRQLRIANIKAYIRTRPAGTPISVKELVYEGGYRSYGSGSVAISKLVAQGELARVKAPESFKSLWTIPGDTQIVHEATTAKSVPEESKPQDVVDTKGIQDIVFVLKVEKLGQAFSWKENSDSLRDFIKSLK